MKAEDDDMLVYDEDEAVKFILNFIPKEAKSSIDTDKIEYVLDVVYDFYDENGLIDEDSTEEASIDEEDMFNFIVKNAKNDKIGLSEVDIQMILDGEFEYGKSLGIYTEE
jgi:archaellum component FlaG (FlaF/FlaG flagellin family)